MERRADAFSGLVPFEPRLDSLPAIQRAIWPRLASLPLDAVLGRAEAKDYIDIAAPLDTIGLEEMLGGAETLFGPPFSSILALKALATFDDGDLPTLPISVQSRLRDAARHVDRVPVVGARSPSVLPPEAMRKAGEAT